MRGGRPLANPASPPPSLKMLLLGAIFEKIFWRAKALQPHKLALRAPPWKFPILRPCPLSEILKCRPPRVYFGTYCVCQNEQRVSCLLNVYDVYSIWHG